MLLIIKFTHFYYRDTGEPRDQRVSQVEMVYLVELENLETVDLEDKVTYM